MKGVIAQGERNNWVIKSEKETFPLYPLEKVEHLHIGQKVDFEVVKIEYAVDGKESFFYCAKIKHSAIPEISDGEIEIEAEQKFPNTTTISFDIKQVWIDGAKWYREQLKQRQEK